MGLEQLPLARPVARTLLDQGFAAPKASYKGMAIPGKHGPCPEFQARQPERLRKFFFFSGPETRISTGLIRLAGIADGLDLAVLDRLRVIGCQHFHGDLSLALYAQGTLPFRAMMGCVRILAAGNHRCSPAAVAARSRRLAMLAVGL